MTESMRGLMRGELDRESPEHYTRFTLYTVGRAEVEARGVDVSVLLRPLVWFLSAL